MSRKYKFYDKGWILKARAASARQLGVEEYFEQMKNLYGTN
jgi:hypothetical protein